MKRILVQSVSKRFRRRQAKVGVTTLKSFFLRDLWRRAEKDTYEFWALRDINVAVEPGTTFGVIGRNGSGKSTFLKLISKIMRPDEGSILTEGSVAALIELGAGFHPELTGRENIIINGIILGESKRSIRAKLDDIIEFAEIRDFIDEPVRTYSSGMYLRLGFSVAVNVDPDILLVDEVLSVGDTAFTRKCIARMDEFKARGKTIVFVSHDVGMVASWCDQALWLDQGEVKRMGPAAEVARAYTDSLE